MKTTLLKLPGAKLLTGEQLKTIGGRVRELAFIADDGGGGGSGGTCQDKCSGDWDCGGVNKYCVSYYCNNDGSGGSFKQCGPH